MLPLLAGTLLTAAGCGGSGGAGAGTPGAEAPALTVVVSAPVSSEPWVGTFMRNGAELAAHRLNAAGGVHHGTTAYRVIVTTVDDAGSASQALANARQAVAEHAVCFITDGAGGAAVSSFAARSHLPVFDVFDGGSGLIDARRWPTTYRIAPADTAMAMRLTDYLAGSHPKVALLSDTSTFGSQGAAAMTAGLARDEIALPYRASVPAGSNDLTTQVLAARRAGATLISVWASPGVVAATIAAARQAGWRVPIWAGPSGEDPLVRQQLAAHPRWFDGVGFVSFRITAEVGPKPFQAFRAAYDRQFGEQHVGVTQAGKPVVQPPDWAMFPYDSVRLVAAAVRSLPASTAVSAVAVQHAVDHGVVIVAANGDERGFSPTNHEGVSPDDVYFAQFHGFTFAPVTNDPLSQALPQVNQLG